MLRGYKWALVMLVLGGVVAGAPRRPAPRKKTTAARKRTAVPKPPVVSQKVRAASREYVSGAMDAVAAAALENSAALIPFFEQLYQLEQPGITGPQSLHVLQYGDSHTASDDWAHQLRQLFQGRFGDGGAGYSFAGRPFAGYRRYDVKGGQSPRWETEGLLTKGEDGFYGLGGAAIVTRRAGEMVYLDAEGDRVELHFLRQPGGGSFRIYLDGAEVATVETEGSLGPGYWALDVPEGLKRFTVETISSAPVKLFGWVTERNRGLTWETLGINGASAQLSLRWEESMLREHVGKRNPALIVFAYGSNEAARRDWTAESYRAMFREVLARYRAMAPAASLLVVGPPDRAVRTRKGVLALPQLDMICGTQREAAIEAGAAFWDLRERMGGAGAMKRWVYAGFAQGDFVHLTGNGYRLVGETLYRDLIAHYEEFRRIRQRVFSEANGVNDAAKQDQ
ncbi:MAG: GDSL-type esterase/lipase family protein [Acidobacteriota bacterium]